MSPAYEQPGWCKSTMAGDEELLLPVYRELEDSGIDSDEDMAFARLAELQLNDTSSSDEEVKEIEINYPLLQSRVKEDMDKLKKISARRVDQESENDRSSPQLFEVELTASEEDEDSSVLELVIPLQSSRYKNRVPKKSTWLWLDFFFCYCCFP